ALFAESDITTGHAASNFFSIEPGHYQVQPDEMESTVQTGWQTPWRVCIMGDLKQVVKSTLVTDLASPSKVEDTSWIQPGVVSWIYWAYNHGSNDYQIICQYIDMAAELKLPYMLIDAEWDEMGNGGNIEDALNYAHSKGVKPMIWYNSTTGWIDGAPGPKYRLNKPEDREREFQWCEDHGVAGVKIDFFEEEKERCMNYCIELLECAAKHHLLVNLHGATIPRGWMRTYPNLLSTEAVYGAEWYNNKPVLTNKAACHNATLPFTRGVIGSMDYTPCTFTDSQHPHITTHGHELALTVLFESGLQHLADRPSAYLSQPQQVRDFFTNLPSVWDETELLAGDPGKYVIMYRRLGDKQYIAGINGTDEPMTLPDFNLPKAGLMFADSGIPEQPWTFIEQSAGNVSGLELLPRGGFVIEF
ncbi:MAG: glycoside hydrolase family 97 catalytic domain-containing protein, partial [Bacteroidales bacterium]|nr:glycoside hydrolase family 97 catalytic domain-containing protein [Bacteroidales bacterium]